MIGVQAIDVTNLSSSRGWKEVAAGTKWWAETIPDEDVILRDDPADIQNKLASQQVLVLRTSLDLATTTEGLLSGFDFNAVADWLTDLGTRDVMALAVFRQADRFLLHVTELLPGRPVDWATGLPVTSPRVIDLGAEQTWPECLNADLFAPKRLEFIASHRGPDPLAA